MADIWDVLSNIYLEEDEIFSYTRETRRLLVKKRLLDDVWQRMVNYGEIKPPFIKDINESPFIKFDRKACVVETNDIKRAFLEVKKDGFIIKINKGLSIIVKRGSLAHELGHTFLFNLNKIPIEPYLKIKMIPNSSILNSKKYKKYIYNIEEGFVNMIAGHILVPNIVLKRYVPKRPTLKSFLKACSIFQTTKELMAWRLLRDVYNWALGTTYWEDAILIRYYESKRFKNGIYNVPNRSDEIFKGSLMRTIKISESVWYDILNTDILNECRNIPYKILNNNIEIYVGNENFKFIVEAVYIPSTRPYGQFYIMIRPEKEKYTQAILADYYT